MSTAEQAHFSTQYPARPCPVCDGIRRRRLFRQTFSALSAGSLLAGYDVVVCKGCGFGFADHLPGQEAFDAYYREMSKYEYQHQGGHESPYDLERLRSIVGLIEPFLPGLEARLLDIGCATGRLLALFNERGYRHVVGLDPSPVCAATAERLYGVRVLVGSLTLIDRVAAGEESFDCIIMSGVLEHVRDVASSLRQVRALLAADGLVYVEVPDATRFAHWPDAPFQQFSTEHINYFSPVSLAGLMRRLGFRRAFCRQLTRRQSYGTVMPVVAGLFNPGAEQGGGVPVRDADTERGLAAYVRRSEEADREIRRTIDLLATSREPLIVWGAGTHTLRLLETSRLGEANIRAFVDSNPRYQGRTLRGVPIISPAALSGMVEPILISSWVFQEEIERQVRDELRLANRLLKLYRIPQVDPVGGETP